jgi:hypothetical protein
MRFALTPVFKLKNDLKEIQVLTLHYLIHGQTELGIRCTKALLSCYKKIPELFRGI